MTTTVMVDRGDRRPVRPGPGGPKRGAAGALALGILAGSGTTGTNQHRLGALLITDAPQSASAQDTSTAKFTVTPLRLPGASGLVMLDYLAYDRANDQLWVPAGNTGSVDVIDASTDEVARLTGFAVGEIELRGKRRPFGPSSVTIGDGVVYVGNRADSQICTIAIRPLRAASCYKFAPAAAGLAAAPDALIYVATTRELWVTTGAPPMGIPAADPAIQILDASRPDRLVAAGKIPLPGSAEGYAVDNRRGRFYTNLEETGQTIAIDVKAHAVVSTWSSCADPSGLALDGKRGWVFVACSDHVIVLDTAHGGRVVGSLSAGAGVDNIDYTEDTGLLYVAAADAARLTIARIDQAGRPRPVAVVKTTPGARTVTVGSSARAYVIDPVNGRILKVTPR